MGQHAESEVGRIILSYLKCGYTFQDLMSNYLVRNPGDRDSLVKTLSSLRAYYGEDREWPWLPSATIQDGVICARCKGYGDSPVHWGELCDLCGGTGLGQRALDLTLNIEIERKETG